MWGRLAACAAVGYRRCPVQTGPCLAYTYAQIQPVLLMNRVAIHFCVARVEQPIRKLRVISVWQRFMWKLANLTSGREPIW